MAVKRSVIYCLFSCFATLHCFALWCGVTLALFRFELFISYRRCINQHGRDIQIGGEGDLA